MHDFFSKNYENPRASIARALCSNFVRVKSTVACRIPSISRGVYRCGGLRTNGPIAPTAKVRREVGHGLAGTPKVAHPPRLPQAHPGRMPRLALVSAALAALASGARGHGLLTVPAPRDGTNQAGNNKGRGIGPCGRGDQLNTQARRATTLALLTAPGRGARRAPPPRRSPQWRGS